MRTIGIDFGKTLTYVPLRMTKRILFPNALEVIIRLLNEKHTHVYIISKANPEQRKMVETWLQNNDFYNRSGLPEEHVYFCEKRPEKANICRRLGVTHHIDDRPEVMAHLDKDIKKFMINPVPKDVVKFYNRIHNAKIVTNWLEIEMELFGNNL